MATSYANIVKNIKVAGTKTKMTGGIKLTFPQKAATETKSGSLKSKFTSTDMVRSLTPKTRRKYKSRTTEAKACLLNAKIEIDKSRNLKSDI